MKQYEQKRPRRWRTPVAGLLLLVYLLVYCLLVMVVGQWLTGTNVLIQTGFYALAGIVWVLPTIWLFRWSARDPQTALDNRAIEQRARALHDAGGTDRTA